MVVDNVDEPTSFFVEKMRNGKTPSQYIPRCSHGSLLFTTRSSDMAVDLATPADPIPILRLQQEEGMQLVKRRLRGMDFQDDQILALLAELEYIPIAITQAVAFISKRRLKLVGQYLEQYRKSDVARTRMLTYEFTEHGRHGGSLESVAKTWSLSFEVIRGSNPHAANLLCSTSFLQHQGIPRMLLLCWAEQGRSDGDDQNRDQGGEDELEEAIATLRSYSLIDADDTGQTLSTHHLVQLATQWWLRTEKGPSEAAKWAFLALKSVATCFPEIAWDTRRDYWSICESLLPHAEPLLTYDYSSLPVLVKPEEPRGPCQRDADLERARLLVHTGGYLYWQGALSEAGARSKEFFLIRERHLGERDIETLNSMGLFAWSLCMPKGHPQPHIERAISLSRRVLDLRTEVLGPDHPETIDGLSLLAMALGRNGEYEESELLQRDAAVRSTRVLGPGNSDTLNCLGHLADVLTERNKTEQAVQLRRKVYEVKTRKLGGEHPDVLIAGTNLALLTESAGKEEEALPLMRHVHMLQKKVCGVDHLETLNTAGNIVFSLSQTSETCAEALALCDEVLESAETGSHKGNRDTLKGIERIRGYRQMIQRRVDGESDSESSGWEI